MPRTAGSRQYSSQTAEPNCQRRSDMAIKTQTKPTNQPRNNLSKVKSKASEPAAKQSARKNSRSKSSAKIKTCTASNSGTKRSSRSASRQNTKQATIIDLLSRKDGATLAEIGKATGWQEHSIRGFFSGTLKKRLKLDVGSFKNETGVRCYKLRGNTSDDAKPDTTSTSKAGAKKVAVEQKAAQS